MEINKILLSFLIFLVLGFFVFFAFLPKYHELKNVQSNYFSIKEQYKAKADYYLKIQDVWDDLQLRKESLAKIDSMIPTKLDFSNLTSFLNKISSINGFVIDSLKYEKSEPVKEEKKKNKSKIPLLKKNYFSVIGFCQYSGLKNFIKAIENSSRLIEIKEISINQSNLSEKETNFLKTKIKFFVYSL